MPMATKARGKPVYTKPSLRRKLKDKIQRNSRGGPKGKWTLRKSAVLKHDYEAAGGGYASSARTPAQKGMKRRLTRMTSRRRRTGKQADAGSKRT